MDLYIKVGNGRKILLWHDYWLGHGSLKDLFPEFYNIVTLPEVKLESAKGVHGWNITFRRLLHDWELERAVELFKTLEQFQGFKESEDSLYWKHGNNGVFTVKSAYNYQLRQYTQSDQWPWKSIWKTKAPYKVSCFSWLVAREACLTQENLRRRGFHLCTRCVLCDAARESNSHLFIHCPFTIQLWQFFLNMVGLSWTMPANSCELLKCWNYNGGAVRQKSWWKLVPAVIWWIIWKERNNRVFEDKCNSVQKIKMSCVILFHFWYKENYVEEAESLVDMIGSL